jgi:diguanylate cyclase (GGDEF)-like protein
VGVAILKDITARRDAERRVQELVNFDEITGLPNRANLLQQLDDLVHAPPGAVAGFSLLSIDIPRITELASTMGFGAGDALAMALAARLSQLTADGEQIAHVGGSEFALHVQHADAVDAQQVQQRAHPRALALKAALQMPIALSGTEIFPLCRIGMAHYPHDGSDAHVLLAAAQTARLDALGFDGVAHFRPDTNLPVLRGLQLEAALRHALPRGELRLVYQPQVCLISGALIGVEALLRWQALELGAVSPDEFIPVAERTGLIAAIGDWVIREACEQIVRWRQAGLPALRVHVNISPVQFQLGDVALSIRQALQDTGASAHELGVELTESALMHDDERVAATLRALRASGIEIALDDFGTGYSSLSRLRSLPIDLLKIDRSFVSDVTAAPESASVTRSIINLAHGLQIPVLAEGVETEGQLNMLVANGCDRMQGYFFSRPVSADAVAELLRTGRGLADHLAPRKRHARNLLLVDDEPNVLTALRRLFRRDGYRILSAASGDEALEVLATSEVDVIISDQRMPGMTGVEFLRRTKALYPDTIRMTLSGYTDLQSIIGAVNEGAVYKFLTKPWDDERLREHVAQAFAQKEMADVNRRLQGEVATAYADLATLNQRLTQLLDQQTEQSRLVQASASAARDVVDVLPAAVFGIAPDGMLAYLNQPAAALLPQAQASLGGEPVAPLSDLVCQVRAARAAHPDQGCAVTVQGQRHLAWLRALAGGEAARGELLVLLPMPAAEHAGGAVP